MRADRPTSNPSDERLRYRWLILAAMGMGVACFDGADAQGLPCRTDADCGVNQSCVEGFCGGAPDTSSAGSSTSTTSVDDSSSTSTTDADSSSGSTGPISGCGNDVVEEGEECDPGTAGESADCNSNCTLAQCGDGYTNAAAGEECDDGDPSPYDGCTDQCFAAFFFDDVEQDPATTMKWMMPAGGWMPTDGMWFSGDYPSESGVANLTTFGFAFPAGPPPEGMSYQLRVRHRYRFDNNEDDHDPMVCKAVYNSDGGMIFIRPENQENMEQPIGPPFLDGVELDDDAGCGALGQPLNPLFEDVMPPLAYSGVSNSDNMLEESIIMLPPDVPGGQDVQLVFKVGYDCANCWGETPATGAGWYIDEVVVAPFPGGPPPPMGG